ncbi:asparagine synthase [Poronia punctata]|nr:asparagine synthase [Poronia punctata]
MCGISVIISLKRTPIQTTTTTTTTTTSDLEAQVRKSLDIISHRGPDAQDVWINPDNTIALGHCRLSINDLSPDGLQPLHDDEGHIHAVINGEIYDNDRLREMCVREFGYRFKGHSDSETVVALYKHYGAPKFLDYMRGEFSLVIYDDRNGNVIAARDRFGIKPLFWTIRDDKLLIAAEKKAFLPLGWKPEWDVPSIATTDAFNGGRATTFKGVYKVEPGKYMVISPEGDIEHLQYWDLSYEDKNKVETRSVEEMIQAVREKLVESIRIRLRADVPVGIYLSGGLDSSAVAGIVKHLVEEEGATMGNIEKRIACFCVSFDRNSGFDESPIAERTAKHLGVQLHIKDMDEAEIARNFEDTVWHNEHAIWDLNTVGKFCLSELPREKGFKVILSGEGADEIFAGYPWFPVELLAEADGAMPDLPLQQNPELRERLHEKAAHDLLKSFSFIGEGLGYDALRNDPAVSQRLNGVISPAVFSNRTMATDVYVKTVRDRFPDMERVAQKVDSFSEEAQEKMMTSWHTLHTALYAWTKTLLPNFLLTALGDRCEMAHSIEGRPPYLDHELAELVSHMPPSVKMHYGTHLSSTSTSTSTPSSSSSPSITSGSTRPWFSNEADEDIPVAHQFWEKWILREAAKPFVTDELYRRRKHPYSAPISYAVGGPLHRVFSRLLTKENVENVGFLDWDAVEDAFRKGFGPGAETGSLRHCQVVAGYVTISQKFGVAKAQV